MTKRLNLTGLIFGQLTVLKLDSIKAGRSHWACVCECGNKTTVLAGNLKRGGTGSCGCSRKALDLTGKKFNRLTVISFSHKTKGNIYWSCGCDCGKKSKVRGDSLKDGSVKSCGCLQKEVIGNLRRKHMQSFTKEYRAWLAMKSRCSNPTLKGYEHYGGRGICVCVEWENDFESFFAHIGERPTKKHSVDRIEVNGNYEPGNVRWATQSQQCANRRVRTHCFKGHEYTEESTIKRKDGYRECRTCAEIGKERRKRKIA